jgi:hypothetical protein
MRICACLAGGCLAGVALAAAIFWYGLELLDGQVEPWMA